MLGTVQNATEAREKKKKEIEKEINNHMKFGIQKCGCFLSLSEITWYYEAEHGCSQRKFLLILVPSHCSPCRVQFVLKMYRLVAIAAQRFKYALIINME